MRVFVVLALVALASAGTIPSGRTRVKGTFERSDFAAYKAKYGHSFTNEEENMRHENYLRTVATINAHNAEYDQGKHTWFQGENEFMHWTQEEYDNRNGYIQGSVKADKVYKPTGYAPAQKDWRQEGKVQYVKNQGQCGSCWCFGTNAAIESHAAIQTGMLPDASEQQLLDCAQGNGCQGGLPQYAFQYVAGQGQNGIDTQGSYPYTASDYAGCDTSKTQDGMNVAATISGYQAVSGESSMREVVGSQGPVTVGVEANDNWKSYAGGIFNGPCGTQLNHAVAVVGYTSQAWIVKNSWGGSWGEGGYIMLAYGQNTCGVANDGSYPY